MNRVEVYLKAKEKLEELAKTEHIDINKYYSPATPKTLKENRAMSVLSREREIDALLTDNIWEILSSFIPNHLILSRS